MKRLDFLRLSVTALAGLSVPELTDRHDEWLFDRELIEPTPPDRELVDAVFRIYGRLGRFGPESLLVEKRLDCYWEGPACRLFEAENFEIVLEAERSLWVDRMTVQVKVPVATDAWMKKAIEAREHELPLRGVPLALWAGDTLTAQLGSEIVEIS